MTIGRFAKLTGLSVKALRLYDQRGLLRPAVVDIGSGYRYYSPEQIRLARDIRTLRAARMPLADIQCMLAEDDPDRVEARLARHRARLTAQLREYKHALALLPTADAWCDRTRKDETMETETEVYRCSFCGKDRSEIGRMIAGPNRVYICNECVELCNQIIAQEDGKGASA
jgi:DNA-binding transcriptional MerR regulator